MGSGDEWYTRPDKEPFISSGGQKARAPSEMSLGDGRGDSSCIPLCTPLSSDCSMTSFIRREGNLCTFGSGEIRALGSITTEEFSPRAGDELPGSPFPLFRLYKIFSFWMKVGIKVSHVHAESTPNAASRQPEKKTGWVQHGAKTFPPSSIEMCALAS